MFSPKMLHSCRTFRRQEEVASCLTPSPHTFTIGREAEHPRGHYSSVDWQSSTIPPSGSDPTWIQPQNSELDGCVPSVRRSAVDLTSPFMMQCPTYLLRLSHRLKIAVIPRLMLRPGKTLGQVSSIARPTDTGFCCLLYPSRNRPESLDTRSQVIGDERSPSDSLQAKIQPD